MPQIGWFELLIIVIIAILVIGPKDFPVVLKKIGSWTGTIKRYFSEVQANITQITKIDVAEEDKSKTQKKVKEDEKKY